MSKTMKAWQYSAVNGPLESCLTLNHNVPAPTAASLQKNQLLIEVIDASINPLDYKMPESGFIGRMMVSRPATPGIDFCGRIMATHPSDDAVDPKSSSFKTSQLVFGGFAGVTQMGTLGQYIVVPRQNCVALPAGVDSAQAAAVGTAATSAYQSLRPGTLKPGARVFINGGSGGVGTWAIQFAKAMGCEVTATCSAKNVELCQQLGADEVMDYKSVDIISELKKKPKSFDLVIDNVGSGAELINTSHEALKPGGMFVQVGVGSAMTPSSIMATFKRNIVSAVGGQRYHFVNMDNTDKFLRPIGDWMAEVKVKAVIDSTFSFEEVPAAFRKLREGHARGKIVIHVGGASESG